MAATLTRGLAVRYGQPDRGPAPEPGGALAGDVAAVDDIDRENLVGPVTHAGLKPRPDHALDIGRAGLTECLDRPLQDVGEFPVETEAIGQIMPIDRAVPKPAAVDIDPHGFRKAERRRHNRERGEVFTGQRVELAARIK